MSWRAPKSSRHDIYELILELWPDDAVARKWNGYTRDSDGGWKPSVKKRPLNLAVNALPALRERQSKLAFPVTDPYTKCASFQLGKHYGIVFLNTNRGKIAFVLV